MQNDNQQLFYYQLGTDKQDKLKSGIGGFFNGIMGGPINERRGMYSNDVSKEGEASDSPKEDTGSQMSIKSLPNEEKVLYIFGDDGREEHSLDDEGHSLDDDDGKGD